MVMTVAQMVAVVNPVVEMVSLQIQAQKMVAVVETLVNGSSNQTRSLVVLAQVL